MASETVDDNNSLERLEKSIALYPDFPKKGILFR